ncbi:hypothetical protein HK097_010696, partial [Rhizophlyctis rosea]
ETAKTSSSAVNIEVPNVVSETPVKEEEKQETKRPCSALCSRCQFGFGPFTSADAQLIAEAQNKAGAFAPDDIQLLKALARKTPGATTEEILVELNKLRGWTGEQVKGKLEELTEIEGRGQRRDEGKRSSCFIM